MTTTASAVPTQADGAIMPSVPASLYRRILRRETHSSRSGAAIVVLIALVIVAAYVGLESVYAALGMRALLFSPIDVLATLLSASTTQGGLVIAAGIVAAVVGIILIVVGVTSGRRGRHTIDDSRVAVVVDDQVIAAALSRSARTAAALAPGQVTTWVSRRSARLTVTPASGVRVDEEAVLAAARDELGATAYQPPVTPEVRTTSTGRLGA
ncbi:hypothetical protein GCM10025867_04880 [Frondihabitans sucicola]|uniref:DNA/RNA endonuclease G n=1 Tax=Frondihabitans sucicola TaxID=1268041 RepID=A0ABM8GIR2_9MICO|nr:hypothetical protein [Frondihabitans sucicola]BDZ48247.1 hypothetical protein GCM10025867_04880 [Frondihabitans sucicola]